MRLGAGLLSFFLRHRTASTILAVVCVSRGWGAEIETLAHCATDRLDGALAVLKVAAIIPEFKLRKIPMKVIFADGMIDTMQSSFDQRKEPLRAVNVAISTTVFPGGVIDRFMPLEAPCNDLVSLPIVRHQRRIVINVFGENIT